MKKTKTRRPIHFKWRPLTLLVIGAVMTFANPSSALLQRGVPGPAGNDAAAALSTPSAEVKIDNFAFTPAAVTVKVGTQVTWINHDDIPHTVDSTQGKFKSQALDTDDKFEFRFTEPGEYPFYCRIHPKMTGKVIVQR